MATTKEQVQVVFTADTKQYDKAVNTAEKATNQLTNSVDEFGNAAKQTTEGAIDSLTGTSGLGAAFTNTGKSIVNAAKGLSTFSKALIAAGVGAAIAGIALLVVYWDEIAISLGLATKNLEEFNEEAKGETEKEERNDRDRITSRTEVGISLDKCLEADLRLRVACPVSTRSISQSRLSPP